MDGENTNTSTNTGAPSGDTGGGGSSGGPVTVPTTFSAPASTQAAPSFLDHVPAELKEAAWVKDLARNEKPFEALVRSYDGAQKMIGKTSTGLQVPGDSATEDEIKAFRKALGVPDSTEGYNFTTADLSKEPEAVRAYLEADAKDDSFSKTMKEAALKAGLTPKQFAQLAEASDQWKLGYARDLVAAQEQHKSEQMQKFKMHYGDKADYVQQVAKEVAQRVIPKEIHELGDPEIALIEALRIINEKVYKDDTIGGDPANNAASSKSIREQITEIRNSKAFQDKFHHGHKDALRRLDALYLQEVQVESRGSQR